MTKPTAKELLNRVIRKPIDVTYTASALLLAARVEKVLAMKMVPAEHQRAMGWNDAIDYMRRLLDGGES